jgi:hypothetical protein
MLGVQQSVNRSWPGSAFYMGLADIFGVYFAPTRSVYLVPVRYVSTFYVKLRVEPPRNNQRRNVRFADEYEFDRWTVEALRGVASDPPVALASTG